MKKFLFLLPVLFFWGCATTNQDVQAKRDRLKETTPVCTNEKECKKMWSAAQAWVASNCRMKIQTDTIIQTYTPTGSSTAIGAKIIKVPLGNDQYRILVTIYCANEFGCVPDSWESAFHFNDYLGKFKEKKSN
jgi:hypothetical protein